MSTSNRVDLLRSTLQNEANAIREAGTYKTERVITSDQAVEIVANGQKVLNFCANNYLGLANNPDVINAAHKTLDSHGFGLSSVRFICGTQDIHKELEKKISEFHGTEDTILYPSCFDANAGFFEGILTKDDAIISDALNHASIIDGIRLCKAQRHRFEHMNYEQLEEILKNTQDSRLRFIVTDGVFSMDGDIADLSKITELAEKYNANIFVDECHATGFIGATGRGTPELFGVTDKIDVVNSTLGKALGGGTGGYTTGRKEIIEILRQRSRPYLFSNSVAPAVVGASLKVFDMLSTGSELRDNLVRNTTAFRKGMKAAGFTISGHDDCPIAPIMVGDAKLASVFADEMMKKNIYVIGFSFPVVPKGQARIRVQLSASHTLEQIQYAIDSFTEIGKEVGLLK